MGDCNWGNMLIGAYPATEEGGGGGGLACRATVPHIGCVVSHGAAAVSCCVVLCYAVLCELVGILHNKFTCVTCAGRAIMTWRGGGGWHGTQCNGLCTRVIGTCVTCVTCAGRATMTRRGGASESVPRHVP